MKMRNKQTGKIIEVLPGAILPKFLYEPYVAPKVVVDEAGGMEPAVKKEAKPTAKKKLTVKKAKKGAK